MSRIRTTTRAFFAPLMLSVVVACLSLAPIAAKAQQVSADAALLSEKIAIGEIGTMIIRTVNAAPSELPQQIRAPGLTITKSHEELLRSRNGQSTVSEYHFYYQIIGQTEGKFTIPAQTVRVNNQDLTTKPLEITVYARRAGDEVLDAKRPYFSKLILSSREFYAGQMVPADLKVYVRGLRSIHEIGRPKLKHDQVVVKGFTQAETDALQLEGIPFSTAALAGSFYVLSPGEYAIGPSVVDVRMLESGRFGSIGFFQSTNVRPLQSDAVPVVVKPLPEEGKPDSFRGAVGNFQMSVIAKPKDLKVGDPISLEFEINGVGNLDSLEAPVFLTDDPDTWRPYDARKIVDPSEESDGKTSGRATFSQIVMPRAEVSEIPSFELSFFNPGTGAYEIQKTGPIPITVAPDDRTGNSGAAGGATTVAAPGGSFSRPAAASPEANFDEILFISLATPTWRSSAVPAPVTSRPAFWIAQAFPLIALFAILGVGLTRVARKRADLRQKRKSQVSFENAMAAIGKAGDRGAHYHAVQNALTAWQSETATPAEKLPDAARSGFQALQSRCQWILYGARDAERDRAVSSQEAAENRQILDALSGYIR